MLEVGGYTPLSTTDWPDRLAAVVFIQGCPWRCHYCHNPQLQPRDGEAAQPGASRPSWPDLVRRLGRRGGLIDGVV
ncbi:MAG: anaerobic ribonucleoside-triphosphate reductase activating protein, partial [Aquabacterium sp.]|nr:anaerobic ribonucleoside-triphosphate reductase activating protein [Aquabacterium sp.]